MNIPFIGTQKDLDGVFQSYQASLLYDLFHGSMDDFILRYKRAIVPVYFGEIMSKFCATLVCNAAYIEKAAFVASQLMAVKNWNFDVVICSDIQPESPPQIVPNGVKIVYLDVAGSLDKLPQNARLKHYTYWRLPAIELLAQEYDRILYLDTDVFLIDLDLNRLFNLDMQWAGVAAIRGVHQRHRPLRMPQEFAHHGLPVAPYFNGKRLFIVYSSRAAAHQSW